MKRVCDNKTRVFYFSYPIFTMWVENLSDYVLNSFFNITLSFFLQLFPMQEVTKTYFELLLLTLLLSID